MEFPPDRGERRKHQLAVGEHEGPLQFVARIRDNVPFWTWPRPAVVATRLARPSISTEASVSGPCFVSGRLSPLRKAVDKSRAQCCGCLHRWPCVHSWLSSTAVPREVLRLAHMRRGRSGSLAASSR